MADFDGLEGVAVKGEESVGGKGIPGFGLGSDLIGEVGGPEGVELC